jgi:CheY-like chemotaxis protein
MTTMRVLLCDDHRLIREGLRAILEKAGLEVVGEAENGREGVELAQQLEPDVVLMDISMPDLNGIDATRLLVEALPATKVIDGAPRQSSVAMQASAAQHSASSDVNVADVARGSIRPQNESGTTPCVPTGSLPGVTSATAERAMTGSGSTFEGHRFERASALPRVRAMTPARDEFDEHVPPSNANFQLDCQLRDLAGGFADQGVEQRRHLGLEFNG